MVPCITPRVGRLTVRTTSPWAHREISCRGRPFMDRRSRRWAGRTRSALAWPLADVRIGDHGFGGTDRRSGGPRRDLAARAHGGGGVRPDGASACPRPDLMGRPTCHQQHPGSVALPRSLRGPVACLSVGRHRGVRIGVPVVLVEIQPSASLCVAQVWPSSK